MSARAVKGRNAVGIRQLKAELSRHLRRVQAGETIQVTDRNRVIATINPVAAREGDDPAVRWARALVAAGNASWAGGKPAGSLRPVRLRGAATVADAVLEDRR